MAAPKARKNPAAKSPARPPAKELKPWQLAVFVVLGLLIAGTFVGIGYSKKSHDEYGQWPWARSPVPPRMYYATRHYLAAGAGTLTGMVRVGKTPGGGLIYAASTAKKPPPALIEVAKSTSSPVFAYTLVATP